jgi:hypothetical protein
MSEGKVEIEFNGVPLRGCTGIWVRQEQPQPRLQTGADGKVTTRSHHENSGRITLRFPHDSPGHNELFKLGYATGVLVIKRDGIEMRTQSGIMETQERNSHSSDWLFEAAEVPREFISPR